MGVVSVRDACVITSGSYERRFTAEDGQVYGHIFDPKTGAPARSGLASVTIIGNNGLYGDALSTALFVMGAEKAGVWLEAHPDVQALLIDERGEIWRTADLGEGFTPQGMYAFARVHIVGRGAEK